VDRGTLTDYPKEGGRTVFRIKKSIPEVSYDDQGYIYFYSKRYRRLTEREKRRIEGLCMEAGGEHYQALLEFVTTGLGITSVCAKHYVSESTLQRAVRRYYIAFSKLI